MSDVIDIDIYYLTIPAAAEQLGMDESLIAKIVEIVAIPSLQVGLDSGRRIPTGAVRALAFRAEKRGWPVSVNLEQFEKRWDMTPAAFLEAWNSHSIAHKNHERDGAIEALILTASE